MVRHSSPIMNIPPIVHAVVLSQDPDNYGLNVMVVGIGGGQMPSLPVRVASHGPRDGVRGDFPELPQPGCTGIVAFPRGDHRNGVWLGSFEPALIDASPYSPGLAGVDYTASHSGGWSWHGPDGVAARTLADGTTLLAGSAMPAPTRHTLDGKQARGRTPFTAAERVPQPPSPFPLSLRHPSGASAVLTGAGAGTVTIPDGQPLTLVCAGATLVLDGSGNATLSDSKGATLTLSGGTARVEDKAGTTLTLDGSGDATLATAFSASVLTLSGTDATLAAGSGLLVTMTGAIVSVSDGGGTQFVRLASGGNSTVLKAQ